ncbi:MAG: hypothetical protein ACETV1_08375 [Candidatus Bathyarchaeia archaeon]
MGDSEVVRMFLAKMRFSFLSNDEAFRMHVLGYLTHISSSYSLNDLFSMCFDTLVGNYLIVLLLLRQNPVINLQSVRSIIDVLPRLQHLDDLHFFGFPYGEEVVLEIDERVQKLKPDEIRRLLISCNLLFRIGLLHESRETVESFLNVYRAIDESVYRLRAQLVSSLLDGDFNQFAVIMRKFGYILASEEEIMSKYVDLWQALEKLSIPVYFKIRNLRFNRVLFNGNFYFLRYKSFDGKERIVFPYSQVDLSDVSRIYDPDADTFYTPRERYGRLLLSDVYSFRKVSSVEEPTRQSVFEMMTMSEDDIEKKIRAILRDANTTSHSPVELADVLTLNLFVNNPEDLRLSGFIVKGQSFRTVHLNTIGGQLLQVSHSPVEVVFFVYVHSIDDRALRYFIQECESRQKNYCVVDRNDLARLFKAYDVF